MTQTLPVHRPLVSLADDIQTAWNGHIPREIRACLEDLRQLARVEDEASYRVVAKLRAALGGWRTSAARPIKAELEVILAHYRAEN